MSNLLASKLGEKADGKVAAIAVIIRDEHILLGLREYEKAATVWTAPGGSVDNDESLESAVRREAREETGIDDLQFVGYIGEIKADDRDPLHIFHCQTDQDSQLTEPEKFSEWRWFSLSDFVAGTPENYINEPSRKAVMNYCRENGII